MTSEREAYVYIQLPGSFEAVPAARLRVQTQADGVQLGRLFYDTDGELKVEVDGTVVPFVGKQQPRRGMKRR